jgi:hypothetical protein
VGERIGGNTRTRAVGISASIYRLPRSGFVQRALCQPQDGPNVSYRLIQAIKDGVPGLSIKDELLTLEARKADLRTRLDAPEMPELLHPRMADVYCEKVGSLCLALESEESRTGAEEAIRALIDAILLEPEGDQLRITLKGDLAGMQSEARDTRSPETGDLLVPVQLVAGARDRRYLQLNCVAA